METKKEVDCKNENERFQHGEWKTQSFYLADRKTK